MTWLGRMYVEKGKSLAVFVYLVTRDIALYYFRENTIAGH